VIRLADAEAPGPLALIDEAGAPCGDLWGAEIDAACLEGRLRARLLGPEPVPVPALDGLPMPAALAALVASVQGRGALVHLRNPAQALGPERIAYAEGIRLIGIGSDADEACWDRLLSLGQPCYGVRGRLRLDVSSAHPAAAVSALAFGSFVCEDGCRLRSLHEDRQGVRWAVDADAARATVVVKDGFAAATIPGAAGAWQDRGHEGYVRVVVQAGAGRVWTQPRLIAPRREGGCQS
jgi:hypothetical protein